MDEEVKRSLLDVIEYLYSEEKRHYEESGKPKNHIFNDVRRVDDWLTAMIEQEVRA